MLRRPTPCPPLWLAAVVLVLAGPLRATPPPIGTDAAGFPVYPLCPTESDWEQKSAVLHPGHALRSGSCRPEGPCDNALQRDAVDDDILRVRVIVHMMGDREGTLPDGVAAADVDAQMAELNADYAGGRIVFSHQTRFQRDDRFYCIRAYSTRNNGWRQDIAAMKEAYAEDPGRSINVFVSCQTPNPTGVLMGVATFPWDPDALSNEGGVWVNAAYFGPGNHTLTHEMGHALGLWHTHHGAVETAGCEDECSERTHAPLDPAADGVGDFCGDTPATPINYGCAEPAGVDCDGNAWTAYGPTDVSNYMGYGPDDCTDHFTANQHARMRCWTRNALSPVLDIRPASAPEADEVSFTNYPNPFNPTTTFRFTVTGRSHVTLRVYDVGGRWVAGLVAETKEAGTYEFTWDGIRANGESLPSGVYYARFSAGNEVRARRIILLK